MYSSCLSLVETTWGMIQEIRGHLRFLGWGKGSPNSCHATSQVSHSIQTHRNTIPLWMRVLPKAERSLHWPHQIQTPLKSELFSFRNHVFLKAVVARRPDQMKRDLLLKNAMCVCVLIADIYTLPWVFFFLSSLSDTFSIFSMSETSLVTFKWVSGASRASVWDLINDVSLTRLHPFSVSSQRPRPKWTICPAPCCRGLKKTGSLIFGGKNRPLHPETSWMLAGNGASLGAISSRWWWESSVSWWKISCLYTLTVGAWFYRGPPFFLMNSLWHNVTWCLIAAVGQGDVCVDLDF